MLGPKEYTALWRLCGARRRRDSFARPTDEVAQVRNVLVADRLLVEIDVPEVSLEYDACVTLSDAIDMQTALYEVRDAARLVRFLGVLDALILGACDGRRGVAEIHAATRASGSPLGPAELTNRLEWLRTAGLIEVVGGVPRCKADLALRPDAVIVRGTSSDIGYLISGEQADVLLRCQEPHTIGELATEVGATSEPDTQWLRALISSALASTLLVRPTTLDPMPPVVADRSTSVREEPLFESPTVVELADEPAVVERPEDTTPSGAAQIVPRRATPVPAAAPPPSAPPSLSSRIAEPAARPSDARLALLEGLSLNKDGAAPVVRSERAPRSSAKLPWILLALVVVGDGAYRFMEWRDKPSSTGAASATSDGGTKSAVAPMPAHAFLASGFIAAKTPIVLATTISGRLETMAVAEGDKVSKGQVVATIADAQIRAELELKRARYHDAVRARQRIATLVKAQAATPVELEKAQGAVEIAFAEIGVTQQKLDETRIKSPIDGTVLSVLAHPGELLTVGPGMNLGLLQIADLSTLVAEVNVNEVDLRNVYIGQEADVITDAQRERSHKGTVREIAEQADRAKGTVLVKVDIQPTADGALKPGMAIQVSFLAKAEGSAALPP